MKEAATLAAWERLRSLKDSKDSVTVRISGITKGGAIASLEGIRAFIPASKLSLGYVEENDLNDWLGKSIEARVITAQEEGSKLVLSAKEILREKEAEERRTRISNVQPGLVTEGTVETIKDYGAFINLGKGLSGLLHVSQIVNRRIKTPSEVLKEGDKVKVKVIAVKDGKLSLSMKALEEDAPAEEVVEVTFKLPESKEIGTSLGSLLKGLKL
jgi:small subunit ribosomal protein S1